jgi:hydrogenase maturation protease
VGIKPVQLADYGGSLTPEVQAQVPAALQLGLEELRRWGVEVRERGGAPERDVVIGALRQERYESGRPSAELACRLGDERFLALRAAASAREGDESGGAGT